MAKTKGGLGVRSTGGIEASYPTQPRTGLVLRGGVVPRRRSNIAGDDGLGGSSLPTGSNASSARYTSTASLNSAFLSGP